MNTMSFPKPKISKSEADRISKRIRKGIETDNDIKDLDGFRASHSYALNSFQVWLRNRVRKFDHPVILVQRLKRKRTVLEKLRTGRAKSLSSMNDIAGCRLIFDNVESMHSFRKQILKARIGHKLKYDDREKFNYIKNPKNTGYRGIHDIYRYQPVNNSNSPWEGLLVEIQYRTKAQNSWATAVEVADILRATGVKFEDMESEEGEFFALCSEVIARSEENSNSCFPDLEDQALEEKLVVAGNNTGLSNFFSKLQAREVDGQKFRTHNVLVFLDDETKLETYPNSIEAIEAANAYEESSPNINAVYIKAEDYTQVRAAYKNYFSDAYEFYKLVSKISKAP